MLIDCLAVGAGGAFGAVFRYLCGLVPIKAESGFPVITFAINIIGAFLIGFIVAVSGKRTGFDPRLLLFIKVGICGGFTTFSTFSLESLGLLQNGKYGCAVAYIVSSVVLCVFATMAAQIIAR